MLPFKKTSFYCADVLSKLHALCFEKCWSQKDFSELLSLPTTVGFYNECSFVLCSVCLDEAEILTIGVLPDFRLKGIAFALMNYLETHLREMGIKHIFLEVNENNIQAQNLYVKMGFSQIDCRKKYYTTSTGFADALIFKKELI